MAGRCTKYCQLLSRGWWKIESLESRIGKKLEDSVRRLVSVPYCTPFWAHYIQRKLGAGDWLAFVLSLAYDVLVLYFLVVMLQSLAAGAAVVRCAPVSYLPPIGR